MTPSSPSKRAPIIVIADDDEGHAILVRENLETAGLGSRFERFSDGQAVLDFFFHHGAGRRSQPGEYYLILLDIRMPKIDGIAVLRQLKTDPELRRLPVFMLTTTDDPGEIEQCYQLGCNSFIQKPVDHEQFAEAIRRLGRFMSLRLVSIVKG